MTMLARLYVGTTTLKNGRGIDGEERVGFGFRMIQLVVLAAGPPRAYRLGLSVSC
jgi:hypothetical protein